MSLRPVLSWFTKQVLGKPGLHSCRKPKQITNPSALNGASTSSAPVLWDTMGNLAESIRAGGGKGLGSGRR